MLYPSMNDLLKKVNNRYLLVNIVAKRARDIADAAEFTETKLTEKTVKMALQDIMDGHVVLSDESVVEADDESPR